MATLTTIAFLGTFAPPRVARAGDPETTEPVETPNFADSSNGVRSGGDAASATARTATKSRKAPVNSKGAFTRSIDIQVPPGRLGMTPALSLNYDSSSVAESAVGVGWSLGMPAISRSTRQGFPKVTGPIDYTYARTYDSTAAVFTGPHGEMVAATDGPAGADQLFAPAREGSAVRYEYIAGSDRFVEHDPSGKKRYYGQDPFPSSKTGRIKNELGTHAWLLVREEDEHGNYITYSYHNDTQAERANKRAAQAMPILRRVEWGGNRTTSPTQSFFAETLVEAQAGPINLLEGNTVLEHRVSRIDVGVDGAVKWSYSLGYATSLESGKTLLANVQRAGDAPETTTFAYSAGRPASGPRFQEMGAVSPGFDRVYTDDSLWQQAARALWNPTRSSPEVAVQAAGFRAGLKLIDVDGNGTTDAIYHAAGIGTTATHVLWEESALQAPSISGLGGWSLPTPGDPNGPSVQPGTGLPYFPTQTGAGSWSRSDFDSSMLQDLVDIDGDGDADGLALPVYLNVRAAPGVALLDPPPPHGDQMLPYGQMLIRTVTNTARSTGVTHAPTQFVNHWPVSAGQLASEIKAVSGGDGGAALKYLVEPASDLQLPIVDLNADGKSDVVLVKRHHLGVNGDAPYAGGAFGVPPEAMGRVYQGISSRPTGTRSTESFDPYVHHLVAERQRTVLVDETLLGSTTPPEEYAELELPAGTLKIDNFPPNTPIVLLAAMNGPIPVPGWPGGGPYGGPDRPWSPPRRPDTLRWWQPQIDPAGDVYLPLRDNYYLGADAINWTHLPGAFRFVPRVYLMRGDAARAVVSEADENTSQFERSLQSILNNGGVEACDTFSCTYPPHINFNSFFADLNGDGLPDLVSAIPPTAWTDGAGRITTCEDGHRVQLNRGYSFESSPGETYPHQFALNPLEVVANRDRFCDTTRPRINDRNRVVLPTFPIAGMAQTDINGDGRLDIVLAYQRDVDSESTTQAIYLNTSRGFMYAAPGSFGLPPDVAIARNVQMPKEVTGASTALPSWPRGGLVDMARFVDLDNDGLVDIVRAGMCRNIAPFGQRACQQAKWYRNMGTLPDRLEHVTSSSGAWTHVEYDSPKGSLVTLPEDGLRPPATMRVVKTVRSAAGPVPAPAGYDPFPVQETRLSYQNFVKDVVSNEVLGFEKVTAEFVNELDGAPRETVRVTQTFDVRPELFDDNGVVLPVRHPLKGAILSTVTESAGWVATELVEYRAEPLGTGVRIRPRRELHGDTSPSYASAWSAEETLSFDAFGNPTARASGNFDGAGISPPDQRRVTGTQYENRTTGAGQQWQLGLVTRQQTQGYSEDIDGNIDPEHVLGEVVTTYNPAGDVATSTRVNIRAASCAGAADDVTTYEYLPNGLRSAVHEANGARNVFTTYDAKSLYPARVETTVTTPANKLLAVTFLTDLRTGKTTQTTDPNGSAITSTFDTSGRLLTKKAPDNSFLEQNVYVDAFPRSETSTITTDVGKTFQRRTQLDADGHVLSVVEGDGTAAVPWSRKSKTRFDAFGRAVESYLPAIVSAIGDGVTPAAGPKDVTTFDGFDRAIQVTNADGTTTSTSYEPRDTTETNARAIPTRRSYDAFGELVAVTRNVGGSPETTHSFVRDGRGEIVSVTDGDGSVRRLERDGGGRLRHVTLPTAPGATPSRFSMCHDIDDKLVRLESPSGRVVDMTYDELGRPLTRHATDAAGLSVDTTQVYDQGLAGAYPLGRLTSKTDESGVYSLTYDSFGRPKTITFAPSARAKAGATNVAATYGATFTYSPAGALKSVAFTGLPGSNAPSLVYTRDVKGRATIVDSKQGATTTTVMADVVHDAADRVTGARYGNGTSGAWTFNPLNERLDRIAYLDSAGAVLAAMGYTYDANANPTNEDREKNGALHSQKVHTFDGLDRLATTEASIPNASSQAESLAFSASGNIIIAGWDVYSYESPVTAQAVTHVADIFGEKQRNLGYDADGYLASDQETRADGSSSTRTLAFDPTGCMRSITREDLSAEGTTSSAASEYTCGLDGRVVARATTKPDGSSSRRIDFAGLAEIRPDEGIFMLRVPLGGSVSVEDARSLTNGARVTALSGYLVNDARGSVLATTDFASGAPSFSREAEYDAWGKKLPDYSALSAPRHGFAGAEADEAVGTYSFGARTYDPTLRRWVSPDPLLTAVPSTAESLGESLNLYSYADGNPVTNTDKSGFCPLCIAGVVVGIGFGVVAIASTFGSDDAARQQKLHEDKTPVQKAFLSVGVLTAPVAVANGVSTLAAAPAAAATPAAKPEGPACFAAGTPVLTESGAEPIEAIQPGDHVWSRQETTGAVELRVVSRVFRTPAQRTIDIHSQSEDGRRTVVRATMVHPFWVSGRRWIPAGELRPGDELWSNGDDRWTVTAISEVAGPEDVYNLEVDGTHTYFAGNAALWVHNSDDCVGKAEQLKANSAQGAKGEAVAKAELAKTQPGVQEQVTVKTTGGRTKLDLVGKEAATGATKLTEVKTGGAKLNPNQAARFKEIEASGGTVAGNGKPGFPGGTKIPPTKVDIVRPKIEPSR